MRLPINQLLYLTIFGLLGTSGWQFYETWQERGRTSKSGEEVKDEVAKKVKQGWEMKAVVKGPDYTVNQPWERFKSANLIGKEPPPPPRQADLKKEEPKPEERDIPLADICGIVCLVFEEGESRCVVRYLPTSGVEPPAELKNARPGGVMDTVPSPGKNKPRGGSNRPRNSGQGRGVKRNAKRAAPMPRNPGLDGWVHILELESTLWKPYDYIKLVRVDDGAEFAEFVRTKSGEEGKPERLFRGELGLSQDILAKLSDGRKSAKQLEKKPEELQSGPFSGFGAWAGGDETKRIRGDFHIGRKDWDVWRKDSNRIVNREVATRSYSKGNVSGVQVTRVSKRFQQMGVVSGDVIVAINGESVSSKSAAIKVGKQLYKRGVRTFNVTFLSRGRQVVRTYVAPERGR